jgi:hypothetical protein
MTLWLLTTSYQAVPRWVNVVNLVGSAMVAILAWLVAGAVRFSTGPAWGLLVVFVVRSGTGMWSLTFLRNGFDVVAAGVGSAFAALVVVFLYVTVRAIRREAAAVTP